MDILNVNSIVKRFGDFEAVSKVSFSVEQGTVFGLLGPNGAGKTTTIRMMTNILRPDEGEVSLFGEKVGSLQQIRIGYLPEERGLYKKIKVIDQLIYFGQLKGMSRTDAQSEARKWLKKLDAESWETKKIQELSKGMQQKVQFITTILHNPDLLILDEPFSGFDPINTEIIKKIISDLKTEGKTIILSTHIMEQVEQLCDQICLINKGKMILSGMVREIKKNYGRDTIIMEWDGDDSFLNEFSNIKYINRSNNRAEFRITDGLKPMEILHKASQKNNIYKFELAEPSLNEIFIDVVTKQGVDNES
jgi:ABC-2 type transport system ATP-binding protein